MRWLKGKCGERTEWAHYWHEMKQSHCACERLSEQGKRSGPWNGMKGWLCAYEGGEPLLSCECKAGSEMNEAECGEMRVGLRPRNETECSENE